MDRNKLDDPAGPTLASVLADLYGQNYTDPRLGSDSADFDTRNILGAMANQKAASDREPYEALTRLLTTWGMPVAAAAHRAISGSNLPKAISRHIAQEYKDGNESLTPFTSPFLAAYLMAKTPAAGRWGVAYNDALSRGAYAEAASVPKPPGSHAYSTARMLEHLNRTEPKTWTLY